MRLKALFLRSAILTMSILGFSQMCRAAECKGQDGPLGVERTIAVDPKEHPRIGTMQYSESLPLADHEVVLTFDDGPSPRYTNQILDTLAAECVKATFLMVGEMAKAHPAEVRRVLSEGHTIGTHSYSHPFTFRKMNEQKAGAEIDAGIAAVAAAMEDPAQLAPFFRVPGFLTAPPTEAALAKRGLMVWSADFPADDWMNISSAEIVKRAMSRLDAMGRGILLLHDIHERTAEALPIILKDLKAKGYRIVHVVPASAKVAKTETAAEQWLLPRHRNSLIAGTGTPDDTFPTRSSEPSNAGSGPSSDKLPGLSGAYLAAIQGLAPVSALSNSERGRTALSDNLAMTISIEQGHALYAHAPSLEETRNQALRDAYIADRNAFELSDGLGSTLAPAYRKRTTLDSSNDGRTEKFEALSPTISPLLDFASAVSNSDAISGKHFFANGTLDGTTTAPPDAHKLLEQAHGILDVFGLAYNASKGPKPAHLNGNPGPFLTQVSPINFNGRDFFGERSSNSHWLRGPSQDLSRSPSFPSVHAAHAYTEGILLGLLVPERYQQMLARAAEYSNSRVVLGAHYVMDVVAGRSLALHDLAHLLSNKQGYVGTNRTGQRIDDFRKEITAARLEVAAALANECGSSLQDCAARDSGRFADAAKNELLIQATLTYGLPVVFPENADRFEDVAKLTPEAGYLLTTAFPYLTLDEANNILTVTEGPGGGFLDDGSPFGIYSRLDLYRAAGKAMALAPAVSSLH